MLQGKHSAILSTFIKLPFVIKIFVLSIFEWPLKTGFTILACMQKMPLIFDLTDFIFTVKFTKAVTSQHCCIIQGRLPVRIIACCHTQDLFTFD